MKLKTPTQIIFTLFIITVLIFPFFTFAEEKGLVPCGTGEVGCNVCDFVILVNNVVEFMLKILILPACVIALIIAGILILTAVGDPGKIQKGKDIFKYAVIGILISFGSWILINNLLIKIIDQGNFGSVWFDFPTTCTSVSPKPPSPPSPPTPPTPGGTFNNGPSPELEELEACMKKELPSMYVTSTTDNNIASGTCDPTKHDGSESFNDSNNCQHAEYSCHYGGRESTCVEKGSYALDMRTNISSTDAQNAAKKCGSTYFKDEGNHYHVSIGAKYGCGCN